MMSLFIDTSNFKLIVAVINEKNNEICAYYNQVLKSDLSVKVLDVVRECIDNSNVTPSQIDKLYVVNGPGSFTGIRIGVTIGKTFAWALKKKIIPVSSLEVLATTKCDTKYIVPMIDARRNAVFAGIYDKALNTVLNDQYISLDDLYNKIDNNYTMVSDDNIENYDVLNSNVDILRIVEKHKNDEGLEPHAFNPVYLKITEAEANLNNNDKRD